MSIVRNVGGVFAAGLLVAGSLGVGCGDDPGAENDNEDPGAVSCDEATALEGPIDEDTTIGPGCYEVADSVDVTATLTIEPATTLQFGDGTRLTAGEGSEIVADGDQEGSILMTSESDSAGSWYGVIIESGDGHLFDHVTIEEAGDSSQIATDGYGANLILAGSAASVTNSQFRSSAEHGIEVTGDSDGFADFGGNTFGDNDESSVRLRSYHIGALNDDTAFEDDDAYLSVSGGTTDTDQTWPGLDAAYHTTSTVTVSGAEVTMEPGFDFQAGDADRLLVDDSGAVVAEGDDDDEIVFGAVSDSPGSWPGIVVESSAEQTFDHVRFEHGGDGSQVASDGFDANVTLLDGQMSLTNSVVADSSGFGIAVSGNANGFSDFEANEFSGHGDAPIRLASSQIGGLNSDTVFEEQSDAEYVLVSGGTTSNEQTWPALDVAYRSTNTVTITDSDVTLEPGLHFEFGDGDRFLVDDGGGLVAEGDEDDEIVIDGVSGTPGSWPGLVIESNAQQIFEHVRIEDGGDGSQTATDGYNANLIVLDGWTSATDSHFGNSAGYGISIEDGNVTDGVDGDVMEDLGTFEAAGNTFENNIDGAIQFDD